MKVGYGRRNPHCTNCGDERGGPFGHEISECLYRHGMTAEELAATMDDKKAEQYWGVVADRYFEEQLGPAVHASPHCACGINDAGQRFVDPICRVAP